MTLQTRAVNTKLAEQVHKTQKMECQACRLNNIQKSSKKEVGQIMFLNSREVELIWMWNWPEMGRDLHTIFMARPRTSYKLRCLQVSPLCAAKRSGMSYGTPPRPRVAKAAKKRSPKQPTHLMEEVHSDFAHHIATMLKNLRIKTGYCILNISSEAYDKHLLHVYFLKDTVPL